MRFVASAMRVLISSMVILAFSSLLLSDGTYGAGFAPVKQKKAPAKTEVIVTPEEEPPLVPITPIVPDTPAKKQTPIRPRLPQKKSEAKWLSKTKDGKTLSAQASNIRASAFTVNWKTNFQSEGVTLYLSPEPTPERHQSAIKLASRDAGQGSYDVENLAANVDAFIRIEITADPGLFLYVHARTLGGPRAALDNALREVSLFGPDILALTLANGSGQEWQQGAWHVARSNGDKIPVIRVYRRSVPVSAPDYDIGWERHKDDTVLDVDHKIFLVLEEIIGESEVLKISGPGNLNFVLPYSDRYLETPIIQINQVGYNPRATRRYAYTYGYMGDGGVLKQDNFPAMAQILRMPLSDVKPRLQLYGDIPLRLRVAEDADAGGEVREINLGLLPNSPGVRYRVRIPGIGVSYPTQVSERAFFKAFYIMARGLFHNRWGGNLAPEYTEWSRPVDHPFVYTGESIEFEKKYDKDTPKTGRRALAGGYHDAGDWDQRPMHTVVPMLLMSAYEDDPNRFADRQLTIPESGNGIPDLLDEALWGIAAWEQLQEKDGGVRLGVESYRHPGGYMFSSDDPLPYWTYGRHANITARAAGLFAQASRLLMPFAPNRADKLKQRAMRAYGYAKNKGAAPAYMLYAAGEMQRLMKDNSYQRDFGAAWESMGVYGAFTKYADHHPGFSSYYSAIQAPEQAFAMADYLMSYLLIPTTSLTIKDNSRKWLIEKASRIIEATNKAHAHRNPRPQDGHMGWGQGTTMGRYLENVMAVMRLPDIQASLEAELFDTMSLAADYVLGCNPSGRVFYTGMGSRSVYEPLHLDSLVFIKQGMGPIPGIPAYGPVDGETRAEWAKATMNAFYPRMNEQPHALRYADVRTLVICNESTVWETYAPNIKMMGFLIGPNQLPPNSWKPGGSQHRSPLP